MEPDNADELKEYSRCPNCKIDYEGATIFECQTCGAFFCNFCDFGSQKMKCPHGHDVIKEIGIIVKPKEEQKSPAV